MLVFKKGSYNAVQLLTLYRVINTAVDTFQSDNHCNIPNSEPLCDTCKVKTVCTDLQNLLDYIGKLIDRKS